MPKDVHAPIECEEDDLLGRYALAGRISNRLISEDCPQTIGIYGGWGTGKTSVLNLVKFINQQEIAQSNREDLHFESFDAWKYEEANNLLIPVIVRMRGLLGDINLPAEWYTIAHRVTATAAISIFDAVLKKFADTSRKDIIETYKDVEAHDNQVNYSDRLLEWKKWSDEIEDSEKAFGEIIKTIRERKNYKKIVLCIDNLDRCTPDHVVSLLESIKNFFSASGCVWLLAMDSDVIASYIDHKYEDTAMDGNSYLDKIVPEQYHLSLSPTLDRNEISDLINPPGKWDKSARVSIDERKIPQIPKILVPRRLIKSAQKFYEYYKDPAVGVSPDMILSLIFLYHTWPAFYQRLSSASEEHIIGILDQFFDKNKKRDNASQTEAIPLPEKYIKDNELIYFIRTAFVDYKNGKTENLVQEFMLAFKELRQIGLP